ncbi:hypothetical protein UT300007_28030 [Clostridium sp. CTA-7]
MYDHIVVDAGNNKNLYIKEGHIKTLHCLLISYIKESLYRSKSKVRDDISVVYYLSRKQVN